MRLVPVGVLTVLIAVCSVGSATAEQEKPKSSAPTSRPTASPKSDAKPVEEKKSADPTGRWEERWRKTVEPPCDCDDVNCRAYRPDCTKQ